MSSALKSGTSQDTWLLGYVLVRAIQNCSPLVTSTHSSTHCSHFFTYPRVTHGHLYCMCSQFLVLVQLHNVVPIMITNTITYDHRLCIYLSNNTVCGNAEDLENQKYILLEIMYIQCYCTEYINTAFTKNLHLNIMSIYIKSNKIIVMKCTLPPYKIWSSI
jgi:hypothetical protein